jgi:hypothetical protein
MIRKAIIVMLTLATLGTLVPAVVATWPSDEPWWKGRTIVSSEYWSVIFGIDGAVAVFYSYCPECGGGKSHHPGCWWGDMVFQWDTAPPPEREVEIAGIRWVIGAFPGSRVHLLVVPIWMLSSLLAVYPAIAFIRGPLRRHRRRRKGLCLKCGYDLTGNVSGVCPECGTERERR